MAGIDDAEAGTGRVIVCGLHDEGLRVVEQLLRAGAGCVVVDDDPDPRLVPALESLGVRLVDVDAAQPAGLRRAGIDTAMAVVCAESDDVVTLAIALLARELRPDLRVVVALRSRAVGRALEGLGVDVLDVARLAAPSIAEACLAADRIVLPTTDLVVTEARCLRTGTLRELYGDLTPVAVVPANGPTVLTPGRDQQVAEGDAVLVLGTASDLAGAGIDGDTTRDQRPAFVGARAPRAPRVRRRPLLVQALSGFDRRVGVAVAALAGLMVVSTTVLRLGYRNADGSGMSTLDGAYFTIETIGTVGYGDFYFRDQPDWLRVWAIVLMVVGATLATVFFALLTDALVSRRVAAALGRRRLTGLDDHVVLVGAGSVGVAVARRLRQVGVEVVVIERDPDSRFLSDLRAAGVPVVVGDARSAAEWRRLHLERARAVAVLTSDDLANLETGLLLRDLLAERWREVPVVLRIFESRIAGTVSTSFGFHHVRSPAALAAPWFVGRALGLDVVGTFYAGDQLLLVARLDVAPDSGIDGITLGELPARVRVVRLERPSVAEHPEAAPDAHPHDPAEHPPRSHTRLRAGQTATLIGPYEELLRLLGSVRESGELRSRRRRR